MPITLREIVPGRKSTFWLIKQCVQSKDDNVECGQYFSIEKGLCQDDEHTQVVVQGGRPVFLPPAHGHYWGFVQVHGDSGEEDG